MVIWLSGQHHYLKWYTATTFPHLSFLEKKFRLLDIIWPKGVWLDYPNSLNTIMFLIADDSKRPNFMTIVVQRLGNQKPVFFWVFFFFNLPLETISKQLLLGPEISHCLYHREMIIECLTLYTWFYFRPGRLLTRH